METTPSKSKNQSMWLWLIVVAIVFGLLGWWIGSLSTSTKQSESTSANPDAEVTIEKPSSAVFDGCGFIPAYASRSWFDNLDSEYFSQTGKKLERALGSGPNDVGDRFIEEGCYSASKNLFIFVRSTTYGQPGDIYRYNIQTKSLEKATFNSAGQSFHAIAYGFGAREGDIIHMEPAISGDAGVCSTFFYDYNYVTNVQTFVRQAEGC